MSEQRSVRLFAPAKINWVLTIERKREDGFHDLHTVFQALSWGDELRCRPLTTPCCHITCDAPGVPTDERNLVAKAWRRLTEALPGRVGGLDVELIKRIPAGAGLGGGSSDAAATLVALNRLYDLRLRRTELERHAAALGSDCAFFIRGGTAVGSGRGEKLLPLTTQLPPIWLVIVFPGFPSSTAEAYSHVTYDQWEDGQACARVVAALEQGDIKKLKKSSKNVFYTIAITSDMRYKTLMVRFQEEGLHNPLLSGSGSALFAYAENAQHARQACHNLRQLYPVVFGARLRHTGIGVLSP